jgi:hypothetical protein
MEAQFSRNNLDIVLREVSANLQAIQAQEKPKNNKENVTTTTR